MDPATRTTLSIDDDVLEAARKLAVRERRTVGEVNSELARRGLAGRRAVRNGMPLLQRRSRGIGVTSALVRRLDQNLP